MRTIQHHKNLVSLKRLFKGVFLILFFFLLSNTVLGQDYNLRFEKVSQTGGTLTIKVQMSLTSAENLGTSNLVFTYDGAEINTPVLGTIHNFSGGNYDVMTLTSPATNTVSLNIVLNTDNAGTALATGAGFTDVAEISFTVPDENGSVDFQWQEATTTKTVVYQDDNATRLNSGTLTNNDLSLDATPPAAPSTPDMTVSTDSGNEEHTAGATSDNLTNDQTPTFEGTAEAGSTVKIISSVDGEVGSGTATGGNYSITTSSLTAGAHTITATATDAATNTSGASSGLSINIDVTQPTVVISTTSSDPTNDNPIPVTITFNSEAENMKENDLTIINGTTGDFASADSTTFTVNVTPSGNGIVQVSVGAGRAFDRAGNINTASNTLSLSFDGTAPTLINQALAQTDSDDLQITYQSNETGTLYYVVTTNSSTPTQAQILAGNDQSGTSTNVVSSGNAAVTVTGSDQTIALNGLTLASTTYHLFIYEEDATGNESSVVTNSAAVDATAPTLINQALAQTDSDNLQITYQSNETGTLYYVVTTNSSTPTQAQILAGNDQSGTSTNVVSSGNAAVTVTGSDQTIALNGLTLASTTYHLFIYEEDAAGNESSVVTNNAAVDATAPTLINQALNQRASNALEITYQSNETGTLYYVVTTNSSTPTQAQILAGNDQSGTSTNIVSSGNAAVTVTGSDQTVALNGLTLANTTYHLFIYEEDAAGNESSVVTNDAAVDATAPTLINQALSQTASNALEITYQSNETGTLYYIVTTNSSTPTQAQILAGNDQSGTSTNIVSSGNAAVTVTGSDQTVALNGLTLANTTYHLFIYEEDAVGNESSVATNSVVMDLMAPTLSSVSITSSQTAAEDFADASHATTGNLITLSFTTSEALNGNPTVGMSIGGTGVTATVNDLGSNNYSATYTLLGTENEGAVTFTIDFTDAAGNAGTQVTAVTNSSSVEADFNAPTLSSVTLSTNNSTDNQHGTTGNVVTLSFTSTDVLSANPTVGMSIGGTGVTATVNDLGSNNYSATYTLLGTENEGAITFTIDFTDDAGISGTQVTATTDASSVEADFNAPTLTTVTLITDNGTDNQRAKDGNTVLLDLVSSDVLSALPTVAIKSGGTDVQGPVTVAHDNPGAPDFQNFNVTFTVDGVGSTPGTDKDADGSLSFTVDFVDDAGISGTQVTATTNASTVTVDASAPTVTGVSSSTANGSYIAGDVIAVTVTFSETVTVTGTPQIELETGTTDRTVDYTSGSPGTTLTFEYTVQAGDENSDLRYTSEGALALNSGTINDAAGNAATLTLPTPGSANSLSINKDLVIDTSNPTISSTSPADNATGVGIAEDITITFNEEIAFGTGNITIIDATDASNTITIDAASPGSKASISGAVLTLSPSTALDLNSDYAVNIDATAIDDLAGNSFAGISDGTTFNFTTINTSVAFDVTTSNGAESSSSANLAVSLNTASGSTVTVDYAVIGTATRGTDYTLADGTLTFNPGDVTKNITIASIIDDALDEDDETVIVTLSNPTNAGLGTNTQHTYSIQDNDATPTVAFNTTASNGAESVSSADLQVDLSAVSGRNVTVNYAITGTATGSGTDFTLANGALVISAGDANNNITIGSIVEDALDEVDETVIVSLSSPVNATLGTNTQHIYTINDNDATPTVAFTSATSSGAESVTSANLQVALSAVSDQNASVDYTVTGTASGSGTDYTLNSGTLNFTAGDATEDITIASIISDALDEDDETVIVTLSNPVNLTLGTTTQHTYTILDDDALPTIAFSSTTSSGAESVSSANLEVALSSVSGRDVTVSYTVTGTAANSGTDYTLADGTLTITASNSSNNITIASIIDDAILEADETVIVTLSNPVNANLGTNQVHTYTITDNDNAAVTIADASGNEDDGNITLTATLNNAVDGGFSVDVNTANGTATLTDNDYTAVTSEMLTFTGTAGETKTFTVTPTSDTKFEDGETVTVSMDNLTPVTVSAGDIDVTDGATVTLTNDDAVPTVTLSVDNSSIAEAAGTSAITATLSNPSENDVMVTLAYSGTATSGTDYNSTASTNITISGGSLSASATTGIIATQDTDAEGNETIIVDITAVSNGTENGTQQQTVIIADDDAAIVTSVTSTTTDGSYKAGDMISIDVNFNQPVTVSGTPQLTLETGTTDQIISYVSGSGTATITFAYTVQAGDVSADLDYVDANSLSLNFSSIMSNGLNAIVSLPTPGAANSLGANAALVIDTSAPADPVVTSPAMAVLVNSATQTISGTHAEDGVVIKVYADANNDGVADSGTELTSATVSGNAWTLTVNLTGDDNNNFVVQAIDAAGNTSSAVDVPTITEDSIDPVITSDGGSATAALNVNENSTAVTTVTATDANAVTYSISGGADQALFSMVAGVLTFTSAPDFESPADADMNNTYIVEVTATDGINTDDSQTITVTVIDQDDNSPVITSDGGSATTAINIGENATAVTTVTATDADGVSVVSYSISGGVDQALFSMASGVLTFTSAPDFESPADADMNNTYVVEVTATDGNTSADTQTITVTVTDEDDNSPVITSDGAAATAALNVAENITAVTTVTATDADGVSVVSYSISGGADQALFSMASGVLTFTSAPDFESPADADMNNTYVVEVTATDGNTSADTQTITVTVTDEDDNSPVITSDGGAATATLNVAENGTAVTTVSATDADGVSVVSYSISGGADEALFSMASGVLTFTSAPDFESPTDVDMNNTYVVEVTVTDGVTTADTQEITVTVIDANDIAPVITASQSFSIDETAGNSTAVGTVVATDGDAGTTYSNWTITAGNGQSIFAIDSNTGAITVSDNTNLAARDITASYTLSITVEDGINTSAVETVTINILDTTTPAVPVLTGISTDTGNDASDEVTSDQTLNFSGTAEANSLVEVFIDGISIGSVLADAGGNFTFDHSGTVLPEGSISVTAKTKDASNNESSTSAAMAVTIDTTIPSQPTLGGISDDNGPDGNDFITNDRSIIFSGTAEALSRVGVLFPGGNTRYTTADANGGWILDFSFRDFFPGSYLFSVTAEDLAGNTSVMSNQITLVIDIAPPSVSGIARADANPTSASSVDFTATFSEDVTGVGTGNFTLAFTGTQSANISAVTAVSANTYTITVNSITGEGSFGLNLSNVTGITDIAGNTLNGTLNGEVYSTNFTPTDITISSSSILENNTIGDVVGGFNTTDNDAGDSHTYSLVSGTGDTDNASFTIDGTSLKAAEVFDLETKASYSVRVQTDDGRGGTFEKAFTITIDNVAEPDLRITGNNDIPATPLGISTNFDITIHNDGDALLSITSILYPTAFSGPVSGILIPAGTSQVVTMTFTPTLAQLYTGNITIVTNGGTGTLAVSADGAIITGVDTGRLSAEAINIYPNPASSIITFDLSKFNGKALNIQLFDLSGNKTFGKNDYQGATLELDISGYQQGIYLAYFTDGKDVVQKKFMIKK